MKFFERKMFKIFLRNFGTPFWYMLYNSMIIAYYGTTRQIYEILLRKTKSIELWKLFDWFLIDISIISIYIFFDIYYNKNFFQRKMLLEISLNFTDVPTFLEHSIYGNLLCSIHIYNRKKFFHIIAE